MAEIIKDAIASGGNEVTLSDGGLFDDTALINERAGIVGAEAANVEKLASNGNTATSDEQSAVAEGENSDEYGDFLIEDKTINYHIENFDGPIDLLYTLIKDAKIDIEDIFISEVTSQYVEIVKNTPKDSIDYDYAGEFIVMAAELVYFKSIRTLPKDDEDDYDEDSPEYERQQFINKIKEYALMKEESEKLKELETINRFYRMPVYTDKDYRVALVNFSLPKLVEAFAKVLANADRREQEIIPKKVVKDRFSVHDQMQYILMMLQARRKMLFTDLFEPDYDKSDIVTTFLAVLELMKYGRLRVEQEVVFGIIWLYIVEEQEGLPIEFEEGDDGKY